MAIALSANRLQSAARAVVDSAVVDSNKWTECPPDGRSGAREKPAAMEKVQQPDERQHAEWGASKRIVPASQPRPAEISVATL
jgi:hypothetical protein